MNIEYHTQVEQCPICLREMLKTKNEKKPRGLSRAIRFICRFCLTTANTTCGESYQEHQK